MNPLRLEEAMRRLMDSNKVVYDAETSGLSWQRNHAVGHVLTFGPRPEDSYYLPVRHSGGGNIPGVKVPDDKEGWDGSIHPLEQELIKLLDRPGLLVVGHNLSFDLKFLQRLGCKFEAAFEDTMINAALLDEFMASFSLDFCAKMAGVAGKKTTIYDYLCEKFPELRATPKQAMGHFWRLSGDDPQAVDYAEGDGTTTWQLLDKQRIMLAEQELEKVHAVECRVIPVLARMSTRGVRIDAERLHRVKEIVEGLRRGALSSLPPDFNSRAPSQVRALMEGAGHLDWPMTAPSKTHPKGVPSFNEQWLLSNPIGKNIVAVRKYSNLLASFIEPMIETHLWNGRVHPEYNQLRGDEYGTITGRLSSSQPNLQQIPKRNKELGVLYRSIFIPDDDMEWGSVDFSQCEPRLLAYYSRSTVLLDGYRNNPDFDAHQGVADAAGIDRETGKRVNQTIITGGGKGVLISRYGVTPEKAQESWDKFFTAMPEVKSLQRRAASVMQNKGYVFSLLGRRSRLKDRNKSYIGVNRLLQCGNADILKVKLVEVDDYLKSEGKGAADLLNNVHDSFDLQFQKDQRKVYDESMRIMTSFGDSDLITLDVPMLVDDGVGPNWAVATYGEEACAS